MIWEPDSQFSCPPVLAALRPERVLNDFDGPKIFTTRNEHGQLLLAYWCDEDPATRVERFIIAPTSNKIIASMEAGNITVREALGQPLVWIIDKGYDSSISACWSISFEDIPVEILPLGDVFLYVEHQPYLTVRMAGSRLNRENVPASVIKRTVDSVLTSLKSFAEAASFRDAGVGRPDDAFRMLYDLRAQSMAFASFQVSFKRPEVSPDIQEDFTNISQLVEQTLEWLIGPESTLPAGQDDDRGALALASIVGLTPPRHGLVEEVHINGSITGGHSYVLCREHTVKVKAELKRITTEDPIVEIKGQVRQIDKDRCILTIRDQAAGIDQRCHYDDQFADEAIEALANDDFVLVVGRRKRTGVVEINLLSTNPSDLSDNL